MNEEKHIMFYLSGLGKGGTERVVVNLAEYFKKKKYKVTVVTTHREKQEYHLTNGIDRIVTSDDHDFKNNNSITNFRIRLQTLRKLLKEKKPDVLVSFIGKNNMMALLAAAFQPIDVYVAVRGEPTQEYSGRFMRIISKTLFGLAGGIILQTKQSMDYFPNLIQKKCTVLNNPLRIDFLSENDRSNISDTIVTVGRCDENKNQKLLIDAFSKIADRYPNMKVVIYGDGELRGGLTEYVKDIGMQNRISLPGLTENTRESIKNASIFVLTSDTEGMPNALIEAMSLGLAVISTDCPCGGPAVLIENEKNGILIEPRSEGRLVEALDKLCSDKALREKMGKEALKIKEWLHPDKVNREWEEYLFK